MTDRLAERAEAAQNTAENKRMPDHVRAQAGQEALRLRADMFLRRFGR